MQGAAFIVFSFFTLVTGSRRSLRLELSDARVYEPQIRARLNVLGSGVGSRVQGLFKAYVVGFRVPLQASTPTES